MITSIQRFTAVSLFAFAAAAADLSAQTNATPAKPRIGIMKFDLGGNLDPALGKFLYNELTGKMVESGKFTVVDWEEIDRVLNYVAKSQPNLSPEEAKKQAINQLGLEKMYVGSIAKIGSKLHVGVKVLNLDLTVERSEKVSVTSEDELEKAIADLCEVLNKAPDEAKKFKEQSESFKQLEANLSKETVRAFIKKYPGSVFAKRAEDLWSKEEAKAREKARKSIAGIWKGIMAKRNQTWTIEQKGETVEFTAIVEYQSGGQPPAKFTGTFSNGKLFAKASDYHTFGYDVGITSLDFHGKPFA